jgi:hypothetical protein
LRVQPDFGRGKMFATRNIKQRRELFGSFGS